MAQGRKAEEWFTQEIHLKDTNLATVEELVRRLKGTQKDQLGDYCCDKCKRLQSYAQDGVGMNRRVSGSRMFLW